MASLSLCGTAVAQSSVQLLTEAENAEKSGSHSRAVELYSAALSDKSISDGERRAILKSRAFANERINQANGALEDWTAAISIEPVDASLYGSRGFFYLRLGRHDEALADFDAGSKLLPSSPMFAYGVGRVFSDRRRYDEAINSYSKAISIYPSHSTAYLWRGEAYLAQYRYVEAKADLERALKFGPLLPTDVARAHRGLGFAKVRTDDFAGGVRDLDRALQSLPQDLNALRARAFAQDKLGNRMKAIEDYERILGQQPDDRWAAEQVKRLRDR
jgi:tetratricopeptide (TPR) repeat protein